MSMLTTLTTRQRRTCGLANQRGIEHDREPGAKTNVVDHLDPRMRIVLVSVCSVAAACTYDNGTLLLGFLAAFGLALLARIPLQQLCRRLLSLNGFMVIVLCTLPFSTPGATAFHVFGWPASEQGIAHALRITLTGNLLVTLFTALLSTIEPITFGHALLHLRVPAKLVRILMFAVRYIDVLHQTSLQVQRAMRARGYKPATNLHTLRSSAYLVARLVSESVTRALHVEQAMRCRGWRGQFPALYHFVWQKHDSWCCAIFLGVLALLALR